MVALQTSLWPLQYACSVKTKTETRQDIFSSVRGLHIYFKDLELKAQSLFVLYIPAETTNDLFHKTPFLWGKRFKQLLLAPLIQTDLRKLSDNSWGRSGPNTRHISKLTAFKGQRSRRGERLIHTAAAERFQFLYFMPLPYTRRLSAPQKEIRRLANCLTSARSCALKCPSLWASCGMICASGLGRRRTGLHRFYFFQLIIRLFGKWARGHGGVPATRSRAHTPQNRGMKPKKSDKWAPAIIPARSIQNH